MTSGDDKPQFLTEPLNSAHDRNSFSCGVEALDNYLHKQAAQDFKKHVAVPFVLTPDGTTIAGYYTLSQFAVRLEDLPAHLAKKLPKYPFVPATLLGRLALATPFRGRGDGEALLMDALNRVLQHSRAVASAGVIVDAIDVAAVAFYKKYGFIEFPTVQSRLFLPLRTVEQLFR